MSRLICCEHFEEMKSWFSLKSFSSIIRQKCESQNGCFKKTKRAKYFEKPTFLTPWCAHVRALFSWNTRFEIRPFALLPTFYPIWIRQITCFWAVKSTRIFMIFFWENCFWFKACLVVALAATLSSILCQIRFRHISLKVLSLEHMK